MFLEQKSITVAPGAGQSLAERFAHAEVVARQPGFIRVESGVSIGSANEEVIVLIYWDSKESFLNWKKSDDHIKGHKDRPKNDAVIASHSHQFELIK